MDKLFVLLGFLLFSITHNLTAETAIKISGESCIYSIEVPEGWATISKDSIKAKFGDELIDIALYCKESKNPFQGKYILCRFIPSRSPLSQFDFSKITKEIEQSFNDTNNSQSRDKPRVITDSFLANKENLSFYITGTVISENEKRKFYQAIVPTKFGYLMIAAYQPPYLSAQSCDLSINDFSQGLIIDNNFIYSEPPSKFKLNLWHLFIALAVSSAVYGIIQYSPEIKKLLHKKETLEA